MNVAQGKRDLTLQPTRSTSSKPGLFLYITCLGWIILTTLIRHLSTLSASTAPGPASISIEIKAALLHSLVLILPLAILSRFSSNPRYKIPYTTWLWAAGSTLILAPAHLVPVDEAQTLGIIQISLFFIYLVILRSRSQKMNGINQEKLGVEYLLSKTKPQMWLWLLAGLIGFFSLAPWVLNGALGSFLDSMLNIVLAIEISFVGSILLSQYIWIPLQNRTNKSKQDYFLLSTAIGGMLLLLTSASGFPFGGMQILLLLSIPVLGWSLAAICLHFNQRSSTNLATQVLDTRENILLPSHNGPICLLLALALAGPLLFIDADELALIISSSMEEILFVALRCAATSLLFGIASAIFVTLVLRILKSNPRQEANIRLNMLSNVFLVLSILLVGWLSFNYIRFSQPGLHGERMFVILKDQADVSSASQVKDYNQRRLQVYQALTSHAQESQAGVRKLLDILRISYTPYYLVNAIETVDNPFLRFYLETRPEVDRVLDSPRLRPLPTTQLENQVLSDNPSPSDIPWNISMIRADQVWKELNARGHGIIIGQSDSGVQGDHPDLADQYRGINGDHDYNWLDPWNNTPAPVDLGGHGTHTLGTALGKRTGIAPEAEWIACVNLARNLGNPALYLDCMQFMLAPFPQGADPFTQGKPSLGAHILNNSWGCPEFEGCDFQVFLPAVQALEAAGIFVVAGAGNDGPFCSTISSPLPLYEQVFAVGAVDSRGELANFSSLGPVTVDGSQRSKPDIVAPGVNVLSTLPGATYGSYSGTSMASPHVVGVVALMWSANPDLVGDIHTTRQILIQSASAYHGQLPGCPGSQDTPSTAVGFGVLDALLAVQMALAK